jgi:short-subunit dehydrogenase
MAGSTRRAFSGPSPRQSRAPGAAVVTGGARGVGLEIARRLATRGFSVNVTDIDREGAEGAAATLGPRSWGSLMDVADAAACQETARAAAVRGGSLDVWVNNAGVMPTGPSWEHTAEQRTTALAINTAGTINGTVAALELMIPARSGHVLNIISLAGLVTPPGQALYAASKHAARSFSLGTLMDLRRAGLRDVHVSAVCPDGILTQLLIEKAHDEQAALSWSGQLLRPEYVAERTVALLDSPRAILSIPAWRGGVLRLFDAFPRVFLALQPLVLAATTRRQAAWARGYLRRREELCR